MIKSLRLINWKSFADATLYIDPLTVIIGMNASGKSNILDALCFLQRIASGIPVTTAIVGDERISPLRGGLDFCTRNQSKFFSLTAIITDTAANEFQYHIKISHDSHKAQIATESIIAMDSKFQYLDASFDNNNLTFSRKFSIKSTNNKPELSGFDNTSALSILYQKDEFAETKDIIYYISYLFRNIFILDPIPSHMRGYAPLSEALNPDASNIAGVLAALSEDEKNSIESTLTSYLKQLPERDIERVWTERVGRLASDAMLYCEENWDGKTPQLLDARGMSDGTLRFLAIVAALLTCKEGSLLVIEEIDNGLHPSRADTLVDMLRTLGARRNIDVIVTTHNPALLNALGPEMVPFISVTHRDSSGASAITLLEDIDALPKLMAGGPLGRIVSEGRLESALQRAGD